MRTPLQPSLSDATFGSIVRVSNTCLYETVRVRFTVSSMFLSGKNMILMVLDRTFSNVTLVSLALFLVQSHIQHCRSGLIVRAS